MLEVTWDGCSWDGWPGVMGTEGLGVTMEYQRERTTENLAQRTEKPFGHQT